ncbi:MAG TPA: [FeFe] hydrogenase H-cluster radical SAM maturase HydG [Elusimicrobiota bacterium]|nr:[FeFe] hydrogenase H-cluster radical SAM maturase HydG [Elusimicrobiota bacterium]
MNKTSLDDKTWTQQRIIDDQISRYLDNGKDFIDDAVLDALLEDRTAPDRKRVEDILAKSLSVETLSPEEAACLLRVDDPELLDRMKETGAAVKRKVYDNRIVTFAPMYLSNHCVNNCAYCGLRRENTVIERRALTLDEVKQEAAVLAGQIGHKRVIAVYGEHPSYDIDYMVDSIRAIYDVKVPTRRGMGEIRRVNVNAAPLSIEHLKILGEAGLGTYQVFQETYHHQTYSRIHPANTLKGNYRWRLYAMHRALETGVIDDVGLGVLFGLADWRFEVIGLLLHNIELEKRFGIGAHTLSFPRVEPAANTPYTSRSSRRVSDADFKKLVTVLRLAVPHAGMIVTARENADIRRQVLPLGCTQTDASTRIGVGAYGEDTARQVGEKQQFLLGDTRSLDDVVRELAEMGSITSFCTAGYRCGRTGRCIMELLRSGAEGKFCKMNAVLTFREWLDDFATPATKTAGEKILAVELDQIKHKMPSSYPRLLESYRRIVAGERDIYF